MSNINLLFVSTPAAEPNFFKAFEKYKEQSIMIDFYTSKMDELQVIARYRVLPTPTIVVLNGDKHIGRIVAESPNLNKLQKLMTTLKD